MRTMKSDRNCFQLIRFKPIGREFAAEPIPELGCSRQIDAPPNFSIDRQQKQSNNKVQTHTPQSIDTLQPKNQGFRVWSRCVDEEFDRSLHYIKARYEKALRTFFLIGNGIYSLTNAPLQLTEQLSMNRCVDRTRHTVSIVKNLYSTRL